MSQSPTIQEMVLRTMREETERIVTEEALAAADRVAERVRGLTGSIATRVAAQVNFSEMRNELIISVKLPEKEGR